MYFCASSFESTRDLYTVSYLRDSYAFGPSVRPSIVSKIKLNPPPTTVFAVKPNFACPKKMTDQLEDEGINVCCIS